MYKIRRSSEWRESSKKILGIPAIERKRDRKCCLCGLHGIMWEHEGKYRVLFTSLREAANYLPTEKVPPESKELIVVEVPPAKAALWPTRLAVPDYSQYLQEYNMRRLEDQSKLFDQSEGVEVCDV